VRLLKGDSIARHNYSIQGESRLGAIPVNEFADRVLIRSLGAWRGEAVQYCRFRLFKVGKAENGFGIVFTFDGHTPNWPGTQLRFQARYGRFSLLILRRRPGRWKTTELNRADNTAAAADARNHEILKRRARPTSPRDWRPQSLMRRRACLPAQSPNCFAQCSTYRQPLFAVSSPSC
jgi:hypothetical protein